MKAHAVIFLSIILFLGCKTRKNIVRSVDTQTRIETVATRLDTSRIVEKSLVGMQAEKTEQDNSYIRSTEFDSSGVIRRVYEEWRDVGRAQLSLYNRQRDHLSMSGLSSVSSIIDSSAAKTAETADLKSDSRPVQGLEWVWIMLSVALIFIVIRYIYCNKMLRNQDR